MKHKQKHLKVNKIKENKEKIILKSICEWWIYFIVWFVLKVRDYCNALIKCT